MNSAIIYSPTGSALINLKLCHKTVVGLSNYRHTMEGAFRRVLTPSNSQSLSDEAWLNLLASTLIMWFTYEQSILAPDSPGLLRILDELGRLDTHGLLFDFDTRTT